MPGSPPRMRGKLAALNAVYPYQGITPAYAGKTWPMNIPAEVRWDHPRVCGENLFIFLAALGNGGSPPRMRGKH